MVFTELQDTNLFKPIKIGNVTLKNRLVYAPTTRFRNSSEFVATDSMLEYYTERAKDNGGLLITEATFPAPNFGLYENGPMIYTPQQVEAWSKIVKSVHDAGSFMAVQLWNLGRTADPEALKKRKLPFIAPSAIYFDEASEKAAKECGNELRAMTKEEIKDMVKEYASCAKRSIQEAGFDFVEIHGAHMYLLDQFLQKSSNQRTDEYGGSIENRARFMLEVVDAVIEAVGAERVGIRLSPYAEFQGGEGMHAEINPIVTWGFILSELERRAKNGKRLAYVSVVEPRISGIFDNPAAASIDFSWAKMIWSGILLTAGGYLDKQNISKLGDIVNKDDRTLIGVSRYFTSNPDLANRLKHGYELTPYDRPNFYNYFSNVGYLNFRKYGENEDHSKDNVSPKELA